MSEELNELVNEMNKGDASPENEILDANAESLGDIDDDLDKLASMDDMREAFLKKLKEKSHTFVSTRCYGCGKVLDNSTIDLEFVLATDKSAMSPYVCPDDKKVSWVKNTF